MVEQALVAPKEIEELCRTFPELSEPTETLHHVIGHCEFDID